LLFADFALVSRGGICGQCGVSGGCETVLAWSVNLTYRLWVLPGPAGKKMPAEAWRDLFHPVVGGCGFRGYLNFLSPSDGKRLG
jgi:hypothetical protein